MTSMLLAQVSSGAEFNAVFADLFDSDGNEGVPEARRVLRAAGHHGELAVGAADGAPPRRGGHRILPPGPLAGAQPQAERGPGLHRDDRVIAIAEDDHEAVDTVLSPEEPTNPEVTAIPAPGPAPSSPCLSRPRRAVAPPIRTTSGGGRVQGRAPSRAAAAPPPGTGKPRP